MPPYEEGHLRADPPGWVRQRCSPARIARNRRPDLSRDLLSSPSIRHLSRNVLALTNALSKIHCEWGWLLLPLMSADPAAPAVSRDVAAVLLNTPPTLLQTRLITGLGPSIGLQEWPLDWAWLCLP
jgi:hypothetical protein